MAATCRRDVGQRLLGLRHRNNQRPQSTDGVLLHVSISRDDARLRLKTTAPQGSLLGSRLDPEHYRDTFTVSLSATNTADEILASTGDIHMSE